MIAPIIIISAGCCGSSSLAQILVEDFHIFMGDPVYFVTTSERRDGPKCLYEDVEINYLVDRVADEDSFMEQYLSIVEKRFALDIPWGFKVGGWDNEAIHRMLLEPFCRPLGIVDPILIRLERDVATMKNQADSLDGHQARIRRLLREPLIKEVFPMYLSEIVYGTARVKLGRFFSRHHNWITDHAALHTTDMRNFPSIYPWPTGD